MALIIKHHAVVTDNWQPLEAIPAGALLHPGDAIVPLALWKSARAALSLRPGRLGVRVETDTDPGALAPDLERFDLIAVRFASAADGRGYTLARLLRERYGYRGELRAVGEILRDQLYYLSRCGYDAFALRADQDPLRALDALDDFSVAYQASVERPEPLFRRRLSMRATGNAA